MLQTKILQYEPNLKYEPLNFIYNQTFIQKTKLL
jgi:hypothetical protein